ncbi:hypothetical protein Gotur_010937 [Gossypium turneri]
MQTLDLRLDDVNIFEYIHVPNVICKMEQLRHLYLPEECNPKTKLKLGTLRNLQTLVNFNTKNCYVKDFMNMTNLRELEIRWPFNIEGFNTEELDKNPPIIQSEYLHSLSIINNIINDERRIDPKHLAHLLLSCKNISKLSLNVEIRRLPEYHYLSSNLAYIKLRRKYFCSAQGFPKLESLSLIELNNLEEWKVGEGAMPSLQRLEIQSCIQLKKLPDGLRYRSHCHFFYSAAALHAYHLMLNTEIFALKTASKRTDVFSISSKEDCLLRQMKLEIKKIIAKIKEFTQQLKMYDVTELGDH